MAQTTNTAAAKVRAGQSAMIATLPGGPDRHAGRVSHPRRDRAPHPDVGDTRRIEDDRRRARRRPNGAAISPDGRRYVCNNGGFTSVDDETALLPIARAHDYSGGRTERVDLATGAVDMLYASSDKCSLKGPNDLVFVDMVGSHLGADSAPWRPCRSLSTGTLICYRPARASSAHSRRPSSRISGLALSGHHILGPLSAAAALTPVVGSRAACRGASWLPRRRPASTPHWRT